MESFICKEVGGIHLIHTLQSFSTVHEVEFLKFYTVL
jgi:hypothetical protein